VGDPLGGNGKGVGPPTSAECFAVWEAALVGPMAGFARDPWATLIRQRRCREEDSLVNAIGRTNLALPRAVVFAGIGELPARGATWGGAAGSDWGVLHLMGEGSGGAGRRGGGRREEGVPLGIPRGELQPSVIMMHVALVGGNPMVRSVAGGSSWP
jgi:hypothetical protein